MGQYFRSVLGDADGLNVKVFDRSVDGEYTMAKLMEHSWWDNPFVNAFSEFIYNKPSRVIWWGDYSSEFDSPNCSASYVPSYGEVWGASVNAVGVSSTDFTLDGKFLLNHETKQFVDLDEYKRKSTDKPGWTIHPLPLLTAIGIDFGFGGYLEGSIGYKFVGNWAWQIISIADNSPEAFAELQLVFIERREWFTDV